MAAPTETPVPCPVCTEPLTGRPERCFRCETALGAWWGFEEALSGTELGGARPVAVPVDVNVPESVPPPPARIRLALFSALAVAAALAVGFVSFHATKVERPVSVVEAPTAPVATLPTPAPDPPPSRAASQVVHYRVQRGDSLWRIAASLTGDGSKWKELWPERADADAPIVVGTVLDVHLERLEALR